MYFLSGLGVATGFVMLVFRDTILGFVAGIQLAANRMVSKGDWIQMDKYGADGAVEEVSLTTVKVRNWDKTITMIPAYALVSDAFRNWRACLSRVVVGSNAPSISISTALSFERGRARASE